MKSIILPWYTCKARCTCIKQRIVHISCINVLPPQQFQSFRQTSRLPLRNVQSSRSNRHLFGSSDVRTKRQPVLTTNGYFASPVRATRNIAIPVLNDDTDVNRFRRPNLGGEYYSVYSGLPVYKYTKKHPHGYHGRRKRQAIREQK